MSLNEQELAFILRFRDEASAIANKIGNNLADIAPHADKAKNSINEAAGATSSFHGVIKTLGAAVAAMGVVQVFDKIRDAAIKVEDVNEKLEVALKNNAGAAGQTSESLSKLNKELIANSSFGGSSLKVMEAQLLTFKTLGPEAFERTAKAVVDLSQFMGRDLSQTALLVGRTLENSSDGLDNLTRLGVTFTEVQKRMAQEFSLTNQGAKAQGIILKELEDRFGGAAKKAAEGLGGSFEKLEREGQKFFKILGEGGFGTALKEIVDLMIQVNQQSNGIAQALSTTLGQAMRIAAGAAQLLATHLSTVAAVLAARAVYGIVASLLGTLTAAFAGAAGAVRAFNLALLANPVTLIATVIATAAGGLALYALNSTSAAAASSAHASAAHEQGEAIRGVGEATKETTLALLALTRGELEASLEKNGIRIAEVQKKITEGLKGNGRGLRDPSVGLATTSKELQPLLTEQQKLQAELDKTNDKIKQMGALFKDAAQEGKDASVAQRERLIGETLNRLKGLNPAFAAAEEKRTASLTLQGFRNARRGVGDVNLSDAEIAKLPPEQQALIRSLDQGQAGAEARVARQFRSPFEKEQEGRLDELRTLALPQGKQEAAAAVAAARRNALDSGFGFDQNALENTIGQKKAADLRNEIVQQKEKAAAVGLEGEALARYNATLGKKLDLDRQDHREVKTELETQAIDELNQKFAVTLRDKNREIDLIGQGVVAQEVFNRAKAAGIATEGGTAGDIAKRAEIRAQVLREQNKLSQEAARLNGIEAETILKVANAQLLDRGAREGEILVIQRLAEAKKKGEVVTEEEIASLRRIGEAQEVARQKGMTFEAGIKRSFETFKDLADNVGGAVEQGLGSAFDHATDALVEFTKTGKLNFGDFARSVIDDILRITTRMVLAKGVSSALGFAFPSLFGAAGATAGLSTGGTAASNMGAASIVPGFANGAAFFGGRVIPFANGGVTNGPSFFPMAGGNTGMMGENGPEAIVPLSRKNGRLGVDVTGAGGINITINVNVQGGGPGGPGGPGNGGGDAASATGARLIGEQVSSAVKQAVIDELRNQQRSGGILGPRVI